MSDIAALNRIDSFPYRHRVREVMSVPVLTGRETITLSEVCYRMNEAGVSSIVAVGESERAIGIFTERDLVRILATMGASGLEIALGSAMTHPVTTVDAEAFVYVAIAKMARYGFRHLVVVDPEGRPVGVITGRALLKARTTQALVLGDSIDEARDADDLKEVVSALPRLANGLLGEGVSAANVASVIAANIRGLTARAAQLAEQAMRDHWGPPPASYAVLVLGSAGRGESLLAFDQDNAVVHAGTENDDSWFAELSGRFNKTLDIAGIPFCKGGVMARERRWRRSLDEWRDEIRRWVFSVENQTVLYCDIFFDFWPVWGDRMLAESLRTDAIEAVSQSAFFMQYLAQNVAHMDTAIGVFGQFITRSGRVNVKKFALLPLVAAARLRAIRSRVTATGTDDRFGELRARDQLHADDLRDFVEIRELASRLLLERQLVDIAAGIRPGSDIEPRLLDRYSRERLRWALRRLTALKLICGVGG